jgi:membrane protein YqaA with SNARE-associated domain
LKQARVKRSRRFDWRFYIISGLSFLLMVGLLAVTIYFREDIRNLGAYGYVGVFIVGLLCGVTIIPAPTLWLVFTMGAILHPAYVGLIAGFGGGIGGITVYLTGAGVESIWSRFRARGRAYESEPGKAYDIVRPVESRMWSRGEVFYGKLVKWFGGKGGPWVLFISAASPISPFYFAGLAAGSLRIGLWRFFLTSWAGKTIRYLVIAYAGYYGLNVLLKWLGV